MIVELTIKKKPIAIMKEILTSKNIDKNKKEFKFPPEKELEKVIKRFADPDYRRVNQGLRPNATTEEKIKHNLCKSIGSYVKEKNLTEKELSKSLGINQTKTEYILFAHYKKLSLRCSTYSLGNKS